MKEEALKLADELWEKYLDNNECQHGYALSSGCPNNDCQEQSLYDASAMIRRLVEELDYLKDQISFYEIKNLDSGIIGKIGDSPIHDLVHRTTPQTKPLSDEEMKELINNFPIIFSPQDLLTFGRAIEERHGIK